MQENTRKDVFFLRSVDIDAQPPPGGGEPMADPNLILAVGQGLRPPQISGAVSAARAVVDNLIATNQLADEQALRSLYAANLIQSPTSINIMV